MKSKTFLCVISLLSAITLLNCATTRRSDFSRYNLSLKNTLSIFLLNNEKDYFFCIPIQYVGEYQIAGFKFNNGNILIDDYDILLKRNEINIAVYLNETANEDGGAVEGFNLVYQENNGKVSLSKMAEPLAKKNKPGYTMNHYYIFIEKHLTDNEMENIINKYEKGKVYSKMSVWYDITVDNEEQNDSGIMDDFELYDGLAFDPQPSPQGEGSPLDPAQFPSNLDFFKAKYLRK